MYWSPAKINLYFHVLKKRSDGYHEIASLMQAIDFCDRLIVEPADVETLTCTAPDIPTDSSNLILRAASLFREKTGVKTRFAFHLEKNIPPEAGLGGGSSNAATTLWALNDLTKAEVPASLLAEWGAELGSDVPFFFSSGRAVCSGRGEKIDALDPEEGSVWIAKPKERLLTKEVYEKVAPSTNKQVLRNDLEAAAFSICPKLIERKRALEGMGFSHVQMTGSGSAFYCIGNVEAPSLEEVSFFKGEHLSRDSKHWYKFSQ